MIDFLTAVSEGFGSAGWACYASAKPGASGPVMMGAAVAETPAGIVLATFGAACRGTGEAAAFDWRALPLTIRVIAGGAVLASRQRRWRDVDPAVLAALALDPAAGARALIERDYASAIAAADTN